MTRLYVVAQTDKSAKQEGREAVKRYRKRLLVDYARVRKATIREGAGMQWLPSSFAFWWKESVIRPEKGEIQRKLYGRTI